MSGFVRRGATACAIAVTILAASPTLATQAAPGRDLRTARTSADLLLADDPDTGSVTTVDERINAAAVLGWLPQDEFTMSDRDFVIVLFEKADDYFHPLVKQAAHDAFADVNDAEAPAAFIRTGIFEADRADADFKLVRAQRDTERLSAAQEINWIPVNDADRTLLLRSTNENFLGSLARKAEDGSDVRHGADAAAEGTEEQQLAFIATGIHEAAASDRARKIAEGRAAEIAAEEAKALRDIKAAAIAAALGRVATEFELTQSAERDIIYKIKNEGIGTQVRTTAAIAYNSELPADWRAYLASGVHLAKAADIAEQDRKDKAQHEIDVRQILNDATFDKYKPALAAAASAALLGDDNARVQFLGPGQVAAAKQDIIQPTPYLVIALQGSASKRCVQVAGTPGTPNAGANADAAPMELWDCDENGRQRWHLVPVNATTYTLVSVNSKKCLEVPISNITGDVRLVQSTCVITNRQQFTFVDNGDGTTGLRNLASNKVLTALGGGTGNYTQVGQSAFQAGSAHERWRVIDFSHTQAAAPAPTGPLAFKGVQSGRCVQVAGVATPGAGAYLAKATMELWDCNQNPREVWNVVPIGGNRFSLKSQLSGMCLDLTGGAVANGTAAIQYPCSAAGNHQWVLMSQDPAKNSYLLRNAMTGTYLTVKSGTANASVLHGWQANAAAGQANQRWIPQPIG